MGGLAGGLSRWRPGARQEDGAATASGSGNANTGVVGKSGAVPGDLLVDGSGDAKASGEGDANSGIRLS